MIWRDLWQNAVASVRAWFGAPPPPRRMRVVAPRALPGPVDLRALAAQKMPTLDATAPDSPPDLPLDSIPADPADAPPAHDDAPDDVSPGLSDAQLAVLESLLFVAAEPVQPARLAQALEVDAETVTVLLARLEQALAAPGRGLRLQQFDGKVQLVSAPAAAPAIERFLNLEPSNRLSSPALETLAVIAYRQPVTRAQIEAVRGVDCAGVLRSLTQRGLIAETGRLETVGRPILYGVTESFLQQFGLLTLRELPPLEENDADRLRAALGQDDLSQPDVSPSGPVPTD